MSDGRKFININNARSPEERLEVVERNYSVVLERIQTYDAVITEFASLHDDFISNKEIIEGLASKSNTEIKALNEKFDSLNNKINATKINQDLISNSLNDLRSIQQKNDTYSSESFNVLHKNVEQLRLDLQNHKIEYQNVKQTCSDCEDHVFDLNNSLHEACNEISRANDEINNIKNNLSNSSSAFEARLDQLCISLQDMPQFNEWATKIHIKICNEIAEKQKEFYYQLDRRSQQLKDQLASDPYTADSVKKILKNEMDELSLDGKNAFIKSTNNALQIQLLEKKIENINLILKKYELNK